MRISNLENGKQIPFKFAFTFKFGTTNVFHKDTLVNKLNNM